MYLYSVAKLFLMSSIEERKYMPIISERKMTTLLEDPLPTLETAKKNCTNARKLAHRCYKINIISQGAKQKRERESHYRSTELLS